MTGALLDATLLERFPGRTLDELDGMDWFRFIRADEARRMREIEAQRKRHIAGDLDPKDVPPDLWDAWEVHNALVEDDS